MLCPVRQCPNFNALSAVSFCAAVCSVTYSTIAIGGSIKAGRQPDAEYNLDGFSTAGGLFGVFNALGVVAFACESSSLPCPYPGVFSRVFRQRSMKN